MVQIHWYRFESEQKSFLARPTHHGAEIHWYRLESEQKLFRSIGTGLSLSTNHSWRGSFATVLKFTGADLSPIINDSNPLVQI